MSQLEAALRRAIDGLDPSDREARRIALGNVRASMMRLLAVYEPPLTTEEIEGKIDELDALIAAIEAEFAPPLPSPPPIAKRDEIEREGSEDEDDLQSDDPEDDDLDEDGFDAGEPDDGEGLDEEPEMAPTQRQPAQRLVIAIAVGAGLLAGGAVFIALSPHKTAAPAASTAADASPAAGTAEPGKPLPEPNGSTAEASSQPPAEPSSPASPSTQASVPPSASPAPDSPGATPASAAATIDMPVAPPLGPPASESMIVFDGHDPSVFRSTADNPVRFEGEANGGSVRIASSANSNGARLTVGPGIYQRLAGRNIRVVVVARSAPDSPAAEIRLAYLSGRKLSDWTEQPLDDAYRSLSMNWTVPKQRTGKQDDAVLIEPGIPGDQTAVDIRSVTIDVLP